MGDIEIGGESNVTIIPFIDITPSFTVGSAGDFSTFTNVTASTIESAVNTIISVLANEQSGDGLLLAKSGVGDITLNKSQVGLGAVDNTADSAKPVSTAQQAALDLKANLVSPTFSGTVSGITRAMVGLSAVDNTADSAKPVSTAQQAALNLKANLASPTFSGTVSGITRAMVGLSAVDNTADSAKPVSTLQQAALDLKANLESPSFTGTVSGITRAMVGLSAVDNTADSAKPVSTAQQTALNLKANLASPSLTGVPLAPTAAPGTNSTQIATTAYCDNAVTALVNSAPSTLNTLSEIASALGNDPNLATTLTSSIGTKASLTQANTYSGVQTFDAAVTLNSSVVANSVTLSPTTVSRLQYISDLSTNIVTQISDINTALAARVNPLTNNNTFVGTGNSFENSLQVGDSLIVRHGSQNPTEPGILSFTSGNLTPYGYLQYKGDGQLVINQSQNKPVTIVNSSEQIMYNFPVTDASQNNDVVKLGVLRSLTHRSNYMCFGKNGSVSNPVNLSNNGVTHRAYINWADNTIHNSCLVEVGFTVSMSTGANSSVAGPTSSFFGTYLVHATANAQNTSFLTASIRLIAGANIAQQISSWALPAAGRPLNIGFSNSQKKCWLTLSLPQTNAFNPTQSAYVLQYNFHVRVVACAPKAGVSAFANNGADASSNSDSGGVWLSET